MGFVPIRGASDETSVTAKINLDRHLLGDRLVAYHLASEQGKELGNFLLVLQSLCFFFKKKATFFSFFSFFFFSSPV